MTHLTAGDVNPLGYKTETNYGVPVGNSWAYYADLKGDNGSFTPTDNPNAYVAWRSGSRAFALADYVPTNHEAGYTNVLEVADASGWENIIKNAIGGATSAGLPRLPSRTTGFRVTNENAWPNILEYVGCKTDRLEVKADQPGGIVEFDETVLASYCSPASGTLQLPVVADPAVQWVGGVTLNDNAIYPQNFRLSINNNLGRVKGPLTTIDDVDIAATVALTEGRLDMEFSMDLWMEDLHYITLGGPGFSGTLPSTIEFTLGTAAPLNIELEASLMADGQHHSIVQDKQMETTRWRVHEITVSAPSS